MGNCWAYCVGLFRREANRIQRGGGSKYFRSSTTGEHYTIEFENLVESDEGEESPQPCPRPISEDEIKHLREHHYTAISDKQILIDQKLQAELEAQEEKLRLEEEARNAAQREAARLARERKMKEQLSAQRTRGKADGSGSETQQRKQTSGEDFDVYLQNVKAQSEAFRSNRLPSDTNVVTPNTECSWDFTTKTRSTNEDGTSLDLEWEDEEVTLRQRGRRSRAGHLGTVHTAYLIRIDPPQKSTANIKIKDVKQARIKHILNHRHIQYLNTHSARLFV
ncbi:AP-1 complex-associated regulatory protein isoform X3 [Toxotes jaculatrix]|uniref:AP-1 complex-associated regulatory protein isoform X3 n=1 Tax=Toxotes jaculatrix TaxID=941984 RepID=UPI001B3AE8F0|nr:AP-1 complex-associated regulatory protein isoform X3 [Toxotes jaculatrix]